MGRRGDAVSVKNSNQCGREANIDSARKLSDKVQYVRYCLSGENSAADVKQCSGNRIDA